MSEEKNKNVLVYFTVSDLKVMTARHMLEEAGIESFIINKQDSAYPGLIGGVELYVRSEDEEKAHKILDSEDLLQ